MKFFPNFTDLFDQDSLHKTMDVFIGIINFKHSCFYLFPNLPKTLQNRISFFLREDLLLCKHENMGSASLDILLNKTFVKTNRGIKFISQFVCLTDKAATP